VIPPTELLNRWAQELETLRRCGAAQAAATREQDLRELREWWRERQLDQLTLEEAAAYSGFSVGTIGNKVRAGEIPNAGTKGRPRVRRCDLPARAPGPPGHGATIDLADRILHSKT
jgi:hypothetical protein